MAVSMCLSTHQAPTLVVAAPGTRPLGEACAASHQRCFSLELPTDLNCASDVVFVIVIMEQMGACCWQAG